MNTYVSHGSPNPKITYSANPPITASLLSIQNKNSIQTRSHEPRGILGKSGIWACLGFHALSTSVEFAQRRYTTENIDMVDSGVYISTMSEDTEFNILTCVYLNIFKQPKVSIDPFRYILNATSHLFDSSTYFINFLRALIK